MAPKTLKRLDLFETDWPTRPRKPSITTFSRAAAPRPTVVYDTYWKFAAERQAIYFRRLESPVGPWTSDPILKTYKFTNAYRAADRVSQYLIRDVIYGSPELDWQSTFLRVLLFKIFNKIETWQLIESQCGVVSAQNFDPGRIGNVLKQAMNAGMSVYSAAYIMPSGAGTARNGCKHEMHLALLHQILNSGLYNQIAAACSLSEVYALLLDVPSFGPFLAFQYAIDLNYTSYLNFSEMDFVVPGPGARDGIRKCFSDLGGYSEADVIRWVADRQSFEFARLGIEFKSLWGRPLQLIDCQNLFCEVDKYARVAHPEVRGISGRARIKQTYSPRGALDAPTFPPKWQLDVPTSICSHSTDTLALQILA